MKQSKKKGYLYRAIEDSIKADVINGTMKPGDMLPTEEELCNIFDVSRVTVRRAINDLIEEGVVEKKFGQSASVKRETLTRNAGLIAGLTTEMQKKNIKMFSYILKTEIIEASDKIAHEMEVPEGTEILYIKRIRYANDKAICLQKMFLLNELFEGLDVSRLVNESLYKIFKEEYNIVVSKAEQRIDAIMSDYKTTALLEMKERGPLLKVRYRGFLDDMKCIEYTENYYVGSEYELKIEL